MVKKMISRLSVLAVLIVFLAACSKTSEYTNVIPADASVVASINLKSLASKAGLDDKENEAAKQKILEALKSGMNAATFQQLEKIMKNPSESGIGCNGKRTDLPAGERSRWIQFYDNKRRFACIQ